MKKLLVILVSLCLCISFVLPCAALLPELSYLVIESEQADEITKGLDNYMPYNELYGNPWERSDEENHEIYLWLQDKKTLNDIIEAVEDDEYIPLGIFVDNLFPLLHPDKVSFENVIDYFPKMNLTPDQEERFIDCFYAEGLNVALDLLKYGDDVKVHFIGLGVENLEISVRKSIINEVLQDERIGGAYYISPLPPTIITEDFVPYDLNDDFAADLKDVCLYIRNAAGYDIGYDIDRVKHDVNGDYLIDLGDAATLIKILSGVPYSEAAPGANMGPIGWER